MEEEWRDIVGYEGIYEVSSLGRVKSLPWDGHHKTEIILKPYKMRSGYLQVSLYSNGGGQKRYLIHRLVAMAFLNNPDNLPQVNHIDGNKANNALSNLEWTTVSENNLHACYVLQNKTGNTAPKNIRCIETGEVFSSIRNAARAVGGRANNISRAASGKLKTSCKKH